MRYILFFCLFPLIYCNSIDDLTVQWIENIMNSQQTYNINKQSGLSFSPKRESNPSPVRKPPNPQPSKKVSRSCVTKNYGNGECVEYFLCEDYGTIIDDGAGVLAPRDGSKSCSHHLEVCCELGDIKYSDENTDSVEVSNENTLPNPSPPNKKTPVNHPVSQRPFTIPNHPLAKPSSTDANDGKKVGRSCVTKNYGNGECVEYFLCEDYGTIIDDGAGVLAPRDGSNSCSHHLEVCCELGDIKYSDENTDSVEVSNENTLPNPSPPNKKTPVNHPVSQRPFTIPNHPLAKPSSTDANDGKKVSRSCVTKNYGNGECVEYFLCEDYGTIIDDGAGVLAPRDGSKSCSHHLEVCCELGDIKDSDENTDSVEVSNENTLPNPSPPNKKTPVNHPDSQRPFTIPNNPLAKPSSTDANDGKKVGRSCVTKNYGNGECVEYFLCEDYGTIIDDGAGVLAPRDGSKSCSHHLEVCCELGDIKDSDENTDSVEVSNENTLPNPSPPNKKTPLNHPVSQRPFTIPNHPLAKPSSTDANDGKKSRSECGWSNIQMSQHIPENFRTTNITTASYGEYPFVVAVMLRSDSVVWSSKYYVGGGALIHHRVVLTIAHSIEKLQANQLKCRAGEYDVQTVKEQYPYQERNVNKVVIHEDYYRTSLYNDVALLFLETEFTAAPNIGVACLASVVPQEEDCYSMGWGRDVSNDRRGSFVGILKKVPLPLVSAKDCENMLQTNSRLGPYFELHNSLTCAGGESMVDTCAGDGGSPLVCAVETSGIEKRYVVVGLVSYGLGCGKIGIPGVFANIPHLYSWVTNQLDREHVEKKFIL